MHRTPTAAAITAITTEAAAVEKPTATVLTSAAMGATTIEATESTLTT